MKTKFLGTGVAMITPFDSNKLIDFSSLSKIIKHLISGGVNYIVVMGTTAESVCLTESEKNEVLEFVKQEVAGALPLMYGIGGNNTADVIDKISKADLTGISGILSVAPYYNKPNQAGLYQHFSAIAKVCPKEIILYNVPGRTGSNILPETVLRLANDHENITAIKEASGSVTQIMKIIEKKNADFTVISGDDALTLPLMSVGCEGVISVVANAFPKLYSNMVCLANKGDFKAASEIHYKLLDTIDHMFAQGNPCGVKQYLSLLGLIENELRLPMVVASNDLADQIAKDLMRVIS